MSKPELNRVTATAALVAAIAEAIAAAGEAGLSKEGALGGRWEPRPKRAA